MSTFAALLVRAPPVPGYVPPPNAWTDAKKKRSSPLKMSSVPLPWCTSKSTTATLAKPLADASSAATATEFSRQKPWLGATAVFPSRATWWPGGLTKHAAHGTRRAARTASILIATAARAASSDSPQPMVSPAGVSSTRASGEVARAVAASSDA